MIISASLNRLLQARLIIQFIYAKIVLLFFPTVSELDHFLGLSQVIVLHKIQVNKDSFRSNIYGH